MLHLVLSFDYSLIFIDRLLLVGDDGLARLKVLADPIVNSLLAHFVVVRRFDLYHVFEIVDVTDFSSIELRVVGVSATSSTTELAIMDVDTCVALCFSSYF